ncbi:amidohydrolase [Ruegeria sp. HKCCD4332]|uniref:amidohydrolase n=1 Tax=Ruegeria sp. HKCCD4332 TaxID=2683021 RepID=UPI0014923A56|nr:amidohydrolase [Ruegeria sp. HKCCD4332]NOD76201.1 amidohydrolase family protein [Ruegeria sp. HKCCD4332]
MRDPLLPYKTAYLPNRRDVLKTGSLAAAGALMLPYRTALAQSDAADVVFSGGSILTMDTSNPRAEALAIRDGRIVAAGSQGEIDALTASTTRIIDLDGRTLMPGMIDSHAHSYSVVKDDFIIISPTEVASFDEVMQKLNEGAAKLKEGDWLLAADYDGVVTPGGRQFTLEDMDRIAPNNPFLLLEGSGHAAYANSLAFKIVGIDKNTPDPVAARYVKNDDGELTGRLEELPTFGPFLNAAQQLTDEDMEARTLRFFNSGAKVGITTFGDPSVGQNKGIEDLRLFERIKDRAPVRTRAFLVSTLMDEWAENGIGMGYGDDKMRVAKMKAWSDGATQAYSSYLREPYLGTDSRGALNYTEDQLYEVVKRAHGDGFSLAVHGNGDAAIDLVLRVYEQVLSENPRDDHRHRIEHCSVGHPEQYDKMKELGVSPTYLSGHIRWWGKAFRDNLLGPERVEYYDAAATAVEKGIPFSMHSDYSVSPLGPLRCVQDMVTRVMADGGEVFAPDQRIPVEEALKGVTTHAAWQLHMDDIAGSLEVGKYADLAILEDDPTAVDSMQIENIAVSETWLEGMETDTL